MKLTSIFLLLFGIQLYSQEIMLESERVDSNVKMIENQIKRNKVLESRRCQKEDLFSKNILDEQSVLSYAKDVYKKLYPFNGLEKAEHSIAVREDSSKRLWIVIIVFDGAMDGLVGLIFSKNDGQLIYYGNHWRG